MNKITCVTIGDMNGIGIDILIKLYQKNKINNFILFTNVNCFKNYLKKNKKKIEINIINKNEYKKNKINIYSYFAKNIIENRTLSIKYSYLYCKNNQQKGIITLPVNKSLIKKIEKNFIGHTEYYEKLSKSRITNMMFVYNKLIISTLTTHIKLKDVVKNINKKNFVYNKIYTLYNSLIRDFNIINPKIIIAGVNPHSGENGHLGTEEKKSIIPQIKKLIKNNINVDGPVSGDSMLLKNNLKYYDCLLFIYHDQALIPFKYISNFKGINYTSNLDVIRVSPDHGVAYDLVGKNVASNKSIINCFKLINKINKNINNWKKQKNL